MFDKIRNKMIMFRPYLNTPILVMLLFRQLYSNLKQDEDTSVRDESPGWPHKYVVIAFSTWFMVNATVRIISLYDLFYVFEEVFSALTASKTVNLAYAQCLPYLILLVAGMTFYIF